MNEQDFKFTVGFLLVFAAVLGGAWMNSWLYEKKEMTRHWLYVTATIILMAISVFSLRTLEPEVMLLTALLPPVGLAIGAVLGGVFGQFAVQEDRKESQPSEP